MQRHLAIHSVFLTTIDDFLQGIGQQSIVIGRRSIFHQVPCIQVAQPVASSTDFSQLYFSLKIRHDQSKKFIARVYGVTSVYASLSVPASINSRVTGERIFRHKTAQKTNSRGPEGFYVARKL